MGARLSYKPTSGYFRRAIRDAETKHEAQTVGYAVVDEYERLRQWVRQNGLHPPTWRVMKDELRDKAKDRRARKRKPVLKTTPVLLLTAPPCAVGG